jgi:hypothetical protein
MKYDEYHMLMVVIWLWGYADVSDKRKGSRNLSSIWKKQGKQPETGH